MTRNPYAPARAARSGARQRLLALVAIPFLLLAALSVAPLQGAEEDHRVYLLLVQDAPDDFDTVVQRIRDVVGASDWELAGEFDAGVNQEKCQYRSHVMVLTNPEYTALVLQAGLPGAFAAPVRLAVFEDEGGIHVGAMNPMSLNRTMVAEEGMEAEFAAAAQNLQALGEAAYPDHATLLDYGQRRDKGRIGRTFGIMAGGPFNEKLKEATRVPSRDVMTVAHQLAEGMESVEGEWEWEIRPVFTMDMSEHGFAMVGVTGGPMEAKSFDIVGKGGNDDRENYACPGIDHAPAYPIEIVLAQEEGHVAAYVVAEMFRMKIYFEDAGKMAFAKNMGMPGSIEDEIKDKVRAVLGGH
jgi:uncharacterized protein (DUF302 family)